MIWSASSRASPGGSTIWFHCWVRRSELPKTPSRSTQASASPSTSSSVALDPGGGRQHQVGDLGGGCRIDVRHHQKPAVAGPAVDPVQVGERHPRIGGLHPHHLDVAAVEGAKHVDRVVAGLGWDGALGQTPDLLGQVSVLLLAHHHVGGEPVGERSHLAHGATGRGLAGQAERVGARTADLAGQQMQIGDQVVHPGATGVLVDPHAPQAHRASGLVAVDLGERRDLLLGNAREGAHLLRRVVLEKAGHLRQRGALRPVLEGVTLGLVAVTAPADLFEVLDAALEDDVLFDEGAVELALLDQQMEDAVGQRQIGAGDELDVEVGVVGGRRAPGGDVDDPHPWIVALVLEDAAEEHRVHLRHVVAPDDEVVAGLEVLVAAHRLVRLELGHKADHRRGHAQTRVGVEVVGAQPATEPLRRGVAVKDRPLAGAVHGDGRGAGGVERLLVLRGDEVDRLVPGDALPAGAVPELWMEQPVLAVEKRRQMVALDAQEPLVDRTRLVAAHRQNLAVADPDLDATAGAAVAARRLLPGQVGVRQHPALAGDPGRLFAVAARERRDAGGGGSAEDLEKLSSIHTVFPRRINRIGRSAVPSRGAPLRWRLRRPPRTTRAPGGPGSR